MIIFKEIERFDVKTGEKLKPVKEFDFYICDFTGQPIKDDTNPNMYIIDYNDNDPCAGDSEGEEWLYEWEKENYGDESYHWELFMQSPYIFLTSYDGVEVFDKMIQTAIKEMKDGIYSLDHLLRWSRGKMLEKTLKEGTYTIDQFIEE